MGASLVVMNAGTDVSLIAFAGGPGFATLSGQVEAPTTEGQVLVVAEVAVAGGGSTGFWSIADRAGNYEIIDLPGGNYTVRAFHQSQRYQSVPVFLGTGQIGEAPDIRRTEAATGRVLGTLTLEGAGSAETALQLVVESTYGLGGRSASRGRTLPSTPRPARTM